MLHAHPLIPPMKKGTAHVATHTNNMFSKTFEHHLLQNCHLRQCDFNINFQTKRSKLTLFSQEKELHIVNTERRTCVHIRTDTIIQINFFAT